MIIYRMESDPVCAAHGSFAEVLTLSRLSAKTMRTGLTGCPRLAASTDGSNCGAGLGTVPLPGAL